MKVTVAAIFLALACVLVAILFEVNIAAPALEPLPNGHYGELYGPISFSRIPVHLVLAVVAISGIIIAGITLKRRK